MAKGVLKDIKQPPTLWQRLIGGVMSARLTKAENPSLALDAVGYYYGALLGKAPHPGQARVVRALLWADIKARQFHSLCKDWYPLAHTSFPEDERCAFYVAALYHHGLLIPAPEEQDKLLSRLMKSGWRDSGYWSKLDLPRVELLKRLTDTLGDDEIRITPERLPVLEAAFDTPSLTEAQRINTARWLGVAYRAMGRSDDRAEIIYRYLFVNVADDDENSEYLANLFVGRELDDANACAVYARMVTIADKRGDTATKAQWSLRLSHTYITQNRLGAEAIMPLQAALSVKPGDRLLEAALAYSVGRSDLVLLEPSLLKHMETAIAFESEFVPHFAERQWQWSVVPRALALAWGRLERRDSLALFIYARACELCPDEKVIWNYYALALLEAKDYTRKAIPTYEKAYQANKENIDLAYGLAKAYQENRVHDGGDRRKALVLWEALYRQGSVTHEILTALTEAYVREERLSDTALELLQKMSRQGSEVPGPLLLRVAQEWKSRGDLSVALRWFQEAEKAMPDHFPTLLEYGMLLKEQFSDFPGAVNVLARAVILPAGGKSLEAHLALAESLLALDKREDARRIFQIIIERIDSNHTQTLLHLARLNLKFEEKGMLRAETYYERAANTEPDNPATYQQMVELYRAQGNTKMEQWALEQYLKLGPGDARSYRELADLYIRRREWEKAETALRQVIALGDTERDVYSLLGDVIQQTRRAS
jgi:tetratricopeptide (TPR) repeat protein